MSSEKKATPIPAEPLRVKHVERPHGRPKSYHLTVARFGVNWTATCRSCKASAPFVEGLADVVHLASCSAMGQAA